MTHVVQLQEPRLPYHSAVKDRFGVDKGAWKVLAEAIFPSAKTQESVVMALAYCQARKLDVFKLPRWALCPHAVWNLNAAKP